MESSKKRQHSPNRFSYERMKSKVEANRRRQEEELKKRSQFNAAFDALKSIGLENCRSFQESIVQSMANISFEKVLLVLDAVIDLGHLQMGENISNVALSYIFKSDAELLKPFYSHFVQFRNDILANFSKRHEMNVFAPPTASCVNCNQILTQGWDQQQCRIYDVDKVLNVMKITLWCRDCNLSHGPTGITGRKTAGQPKMFRLYDKRIEIPIIEASHQNYFSFHFCELYCNLL